jgi:kynurenine formamidase
MVASASYWLAQRQVPTVGVDNMAWHVPGARAPELGCFLPRHLILLARRGIYVVENLQLDSLAAKAHRFLFVCTSLKFVGATGSPFWPLALLSECL